MTPKYAIKDISSISLYKKILEELNIQTCDWNVQTSYNFLICLRVKAPESKVCFGFLTKEEAFYIQFFDRDGFSTAVVFTDQAIKSKEIYLDDTAKYDAIETLVRSLLTEYDERFTVALSQIKGFVCL